MENKMKLNTEAPVPMELRYCPRCGALQVRPAHSDANACSRCANVLAWMGMGARV